MGIIKENKDISESAKTTANSKMVLNRTHWITVCCLTPRRIRVILFVVVLFTLATIFIIQKNVTVTHSNGKYCHQNSYLGQDIHLFDDIMEAEKKPIPDQSIFFHETTACTRGGLVELDVRQACSIESAALTSSSLDVFVLFASPTGISYTKAIPPLIHALQSYENIYFRNVNLWKYSEGTPLRHWISNKNQFVSKVWPRNKVLEYLRYTSLFKWGGTCLNLDVMMMTDISEIPHNFAGVDDARHSISSDILNMDRAQSIVGFSERCLYQFGRILNGQLDFEDDNVITNVLKTVCQTVYPYAMTRARCNFNLFPVGAFYAVKNWQHFTNETYANDTLAMIQDSLAVIMHGNKHGDRIRVGSRVAYGMLAATYCPRVYKASGSSF